MKNKDIEQLIQSKEILTELYSGNYIGTVSFDESVSGNALSELEELRNQVSKYRSEENERYQAEAIQREEDRKKNLRNSLIVAAFSSAFTLFLEHFNDIIHFLLEFFHSF